MQSIREGECLHVIERRLFPDDVRRHFVGQVETVNERSVRLKGYLFVYESGSSTFLKKSELRTRIIGLDNRVIINVLPGDVSVQALRYSHDSEGNLCIVDGRGFELDISEFSPKE